MTINGCVIEDSAFNLLARVQVDGVNAVQADVSTITWEAFDISDETSVTTGSLTIASVIYDTLQTDGMWTKDGSGYNFRHEVASTVLTTPGRYRFEHKFTLASGGVFFLDPFVVTVDEVWTS